MKTETYTTKTLAFDEGYALEDVELEIFKPDSDAPGLQLMQGEGMVEVPTEDLGDMVVEMFRMIEFRGDDLDHALEEIQAYIREREIALQAEREDR